MITEKICLMSVFDVAKTNKKLQWIRSDVFIGIALHWVQTSLILFLQKQVMIGKTYEYFARSNIC